PDSRLDAAAFRDSAGLLLQSALRTCFRSLPDREARADCAWRAGRGLPSLRYCCQEHRRQGHRGMTQKPFVEVKDLRRVFDVSKPWLNRILERGHPEFLKA